MNPAWSTDDGRFLFYQEDESKYNELVFEVPGEGCILEEAELHRLYYALSAYLHRMNRINKNITPIEWSAK